MRKLYGPFAMSLLAFACNEVLGLKPGVPANDEGGGGNISAGASGEGGSALVPGSGGAANGGAAATSGGAGPPGGGAAGANPARGGSDSGGGGSSAGTGGSDFGRGGSSAGAGGSDGGDSCASTADCIEQDLAWPPYLCLNGACVDILTDECDRVVGAEWLRDHPEDQPIVFGSITQRLEFLDPSSWSLELAMREFTEHGPLPIDGAPRRPVLLLCQTPSFDSNPAPIHRSLDHLIDNVGVSGMLMLATRPNLMESVKYAQERQADVFFLDFAGGNAELIFQYDQAGRVWHMLGDINYIGAPFIGLVERVEEHVNPGASTGQGARLTRLALVPPSYDDAFESQIARNLESIVRTNNQATAEDPDTYRLVPTSGRLTDVIVGEVAQFEPDIVIDFAGLESEIDAAVLARPAPRPFYILPPSRVGSLPLQEQVASDTSLRTRIVGLNYPGPVDTALYDAYLGRFAATAPGVDGSGSANVYDAVYFLLYAAVAGGTGGANLRAGMERLLAGPQGNIGPTTIDSVLDLLRSEETLSLYGALGPPYFDRSTGGRTTWASVWCMDENLEYVRDALWFESFVQLSGTLPCFDF